MEIKIPEKMEAIDRVRENATIALHRANKQFSGILLKGAISFILAVAESQIIEIQRSDNVRK